MAKLWPLWKVCKQAPAFIACKADAAAFYIMCDFEIHSANPSACCQEHTLVEPFFNSADSINKSFRPPQ